MEALSIELGRDASCVGLVGSNSWFESAKQGLLSSLFLGPILVRQHGVPIALTCVFCQIICLQHVNNLLCGPKGLRVGPRYGPTGL